MSLATGVAALTVGVRALDIAQGVTAWYEENKSQDVGRLYDKVRKLRDERTVVEMFPTTHSKSDDSVRSPNVEALINLFGSNDGKPHPAGVVYVLYDKRGNGKSHAGRALLQEFYQFSEDKVKGVMFTGDMMKDNIPEGICEKLEANSIDGWIHVLLLAMETLAEEHPSVLIIDSLNSVGNENVNVKFIQALYSAMNAEKNIFVIVLTQEKTVAQALLECNGGARVLPLPGCFTGESQSPDWNETNWTVDQLVELVHYRDKGKYNDDEEIRQLVHPGMTPLEVVKVVNARKRKSHETPDSPKKRRAS
mmetsp:Transcript_5390/g.8102  ORF Transcript_5390/g.8102 Transcript_5390/m.8102 type:complete len:307 (+) Transcript_5390:62-982(+)